MSLDASALASTPAVPFVYGSIAFNVGRNRLLNPEHTHKWTVFLRGAHNQDLTYAISRVIFVLHVSYPDYRRGEGAGEEAGRHARLLAALRALLAATIAALTPRAPASPPPPPTKKIRNPRAALPGV